MNEEWQHSLLQAGGKGAGILAPQPGIMPLFYAHIASIGETGEIHHINGYYPRQQPMSNVNRARIAAKRASHVVTETLNQK